MPGKVLKHLEATEMEFGPATQAGQGHWRLARGEDGIAWLVFDRKDSTTNTVSQEVIHELDRHVATLEKDVPEALVIRSAKRVGFAAGADISGFDEISDDGAAKLLQQGHGVLDRIAALTCPTICVVHGAALGAGFEIALACDYRIAVEGASFAFPEVMLGLHPGLGGTLRLTGLIDPVEAMTLMLTGKTAHTKKAKELGIVDLICPERHVPAAVRAVVAGKVEKHEQGLISNSYRLRAARSFAARQMRSKAAENAPEKHYPAPHALIALWEDHGDDREAMQEAEIASFARLLDTETSKNLRRVFFLRQGLKDNAKGEDEITHVHVVGAGAMGREIAAWVAIKGKKVTLGDLELGPLAQAVKQAKTICEAQHLSGIETRNALDRLIPDPEGYGVAQADLVIEAVPESPDLKGDIYADLGKRMKAGAILASNTSSLELTELAGKVRAPTRFAGLHFFNPVSKMQLVEVVAHPKTSKVVVDRLAAFCGSINRLPALVQDYPGFLVNRALTPFLMEAMVLMDEGVTKEVIDSAATEFGMPMGPVALADQVGLDICLDVAESLRGKLEKPMADISDSLREKVEAGQTGRKSGSGFYEWKDGTPEPDTEGTGPADLTDRLILPMLDACVECLRRDVARTENEIDGAMIFATGFPPFRGGPMHYARTRGIGEIKGRLTELADTLGPRFTPDRGWDDLG
ncbi:fatty acid oxidation complex subunit alpha [Roseovarius sp. A-2]|uniref:3-hydroxyacyl-CoA dehydrogenase NAD-binding domain-containing protein n=1 Tax=Roseovarius sp. A-2 TaxID=1570360 RepID=UPI0009B5084B|nr:3-hydroxyacyl-CoA dehydrogenase NAD-binding domain-containing protein [Roseovarius sp. A-2]GAW35431.1 fatty acid oxidation complex subunit alpha [Roseovarius sp. A-2]